MQRNSLKFFRILEFFLKIFQVLFPNQLFQIFHFFHFLFNFVNNWTQPLNEITTMHSTAPKHWSDYTICLPNILIHIWHEARNGLLFFCLHVLLKGHPLITSQKKVQSLTNDQIPTKCRVDIWFDKIYSQSSNAKHFIKKER